jgi:hypothetical protein
MSALNLVTAPTGPLLTLDEAKRHCRVEVDDDDGLIQSYLEASVERAELETGRQLLTATWELWLNSFPGMGRNGSYGASPLSSGMSGMSSWVDWNVLWHIARFIDLPCAPLQFTTVALVGATHGTPTVDGIASTTGVTVGMVVTSLGGADFAPGTTVTALTATTLTLSQAAKSTSASVALTGSTVGVTYVDTAGVLQTWDPSQYQVHAPRGPRAPRGKIQPAYGISWPVTRDQLDAVKVSFVCGYGATGDSVPQLLRRAVGLATADLYENREGTVVTERRVTVQDLLWIDRIFTQYRMRPVLKAAA